MLVNAMIGGPIVFGSETWAYVTSKSLATRHVVSEIEEENYKTGLRSARQFV